MSSAPEHILNSVASITEQRQLQSLATCLIETIEQTLGVKQVAVINVGDLPHFPKFLTSTDFVLALDNPPPCVQQCIETGKNAICDQDERCKVALPVKMNDAVVKVLLVYDLDLNNANLMMLQAFARIYENFARVVLDSQTDGLTGLLNRKAYDARLFHLFSHIRTETRRAPYFWMLTFDIDFFKKINDTLGHLYGDEVLLRISRAMNDCFSDEDALFRFGGDEFVVLLDNKSQHEVEYICRKLMADVGKIQHEKTGPVTLSIGITSLTLEDNPMSVMMKADKALYFAKDNGRNRWAFYHDLFNHGDLLPTQIDDDIELF
ncbi:GGDEF domain-containing protein [Shewanella zhangzhouensis]|uniref:GGDEF domain-containing protein n=1 Tax=Shewanella zhangzhouensis TaxID=2864213 RepID=UPI001C65708A|nr:GGDEF domain-containing protein [Shewanella zhangzhouensis]QYK04195.1 GGDEF domain-containing protein [Shewanella zhangzhouensis]